MHRSVLAFLCSVALFSSCKDKASEEKSASEQHTEAILENPTAPAPSAPLTPSEQVFDFTALAHTGQRLQLSEFLQKPVVVYFCPRDEDPTCKHLAESFRESWLKVNDKISMVFGVSTEDSFTHREFVSTHKLPMLFLADTEQSVHSVMGVKPGTVISFLIGTDRRVRQVFAPPNVAHAQEILNALLVDPKTGRLPEGASSISLENAVYAGDAGAPPKK